MTIEFAQRLPARYTQSLLDMLVSEYQVAPSALADAQALCQPLAEIPEGFISLEQFAQACDIAVEHCDDPWLGVRFGKRLSPVSHGALGGAISSCRCVADMMKLITRFTDTLFPAHFTSQQKADRVFVKSVFPPSIDKNKEFHAQIVVSGTFKLLEDTVGYLPRDIAVHFPFPSNSAYQDKFPYDLHFNSSTLFIEFPLSYMDAPLMSSDPATHQLFVKACESISEQLQSSRSLGEAIKQLLDRYEGNYPSQEQIADMLHVSARTLHKRLAKEQLSFRQLLTDYRIGKAQQFLKEGQLTVADVAECLGYKDTSNFGRAFKRATGLAPGEYRSKD
ncbi:AraC family transcriptional regulator [Maricurvus nonylphenolicus]|uniref:helix-turn-helix transcriptional regulator n=1 Tax=Maricurvus nonylphenolicus TaxID=1008307 RepID=UPI0036F2FE6B